jgi:predicted RNA-binding Zn ribbon-like protein
MGYAGFMAPSPNTPRHVQLVLDAANTLDVELGTDAWRTPSDLARWLDEHHEHDEHDEHDEPDAGKTSTSSGRISKEQHAAAVRLRDALRAAILERRAPEFGDLARPFPLRVELGDGMPALAPVSTAPIRGVAEILACMAKSGYDGTWQRIKICPADDCRMAFYDESRNRSRAWCSMQVCGNRTKTRNFRARRAQT